MNYVVVGDEPGPAKMEKAKNYGIPTISEDEFLDMIRVKSGLPPLSTKNEKCNGESSNKSEAKSESQASKTHKRVSKQSPVKTASSSKEIRSQEHVKIVHSKDLPAIKRSDHKPSEENISWTEKYKPKDLKSIIGQQGEKSNMNKLLNWLKNWYKYHGGKDKVKVSRPSPWAKDDNGAYYTCALLSGPPGVGNYESSCWFELYYREGFG